MHSLCLHAHEPFCFGNQLFSCFTQCYTLFKFGIVQSQYRDCYNNLQLAIIVRYEPWTISLLLASR